MEDNAPESKEKQTFECSKPEIPNRVYRLAEHLEIITTIHSLQRFPTLSSQVGYIPLLLKEETTTKG